MHLPQIGTIGFDPQQNDFYTSTRATATTGATARQSNQKRGEKGLKNTPGDPGDLSFGLPYFMFFLKKEKKRKKHSHIETKEEPKRKNTPNKKTGYHEKAIKQMPSTQAWLFHLYPKWLKSTAGTNGPPLEGARSWSFSWPPVKKQRNTQTKRNQLKTRNPTQMALPVNASHFLVSNPFHVSRPIEWIGKQDSQKL